MGILCVNSLNFSQYNAGKMPLYKTFLNYINNFRVCKLSTDIVLRAIYYYVMHVGVWSVCVDVHCMHAWCPGKPEWGIRYPKTGVIDDCEAVYCKCRQWNPSSLQEMQDLLTTELSLQFSCFTASLRYL